MLLIINYFIFFRCFYYKQALLSWDTTKTNCDLKELQNFWDELSNRKEVEKNESGM